jgi:hypothetical protein
MRQPRELPSRKALRKALAEYHTPSSNLGRAIQRSLRTLDKATLRLQACFESRAKGIEDEQKRSAEHSRIAAARALRDAEAEADRELAATGAVSLAAKQSFAYSKVKITMVDLLAKQAATFVTRANEIERDLFAWHDQITRACIDALWDDAAIERVVTVGSAGAAAAAFFPAAAPAAALIAAGLALADLKSKFLSASQNREERAIARREGALVLLEFANQITASWLRTLNCR